MSTNGLGAATAPLPASILSQGPNLIVSIHAALDDEQLMRLQRDLLERVGRERSRGILIDVAALDVLDSFAARTLGDLAPLTADLPAPTSAPARTGDEPVAGHPARREESGSGWRVVWGSWLTVTLVCIAVWGAVSVSEGELGYFWPIWVAAPWGALLLARTLRGRR